MRSARYVVPQIMQTAARATYGKYDVRCVRVTTIDLRV